MKITTSTATVQDGLEEMLRNTTNQLQGINDQMKVIEKRNEELQELLTDAAKPFKLVAVQLQDAVLYFPVVVAIVCAYLTFEFLVLFSRVRRLLAAYQALGMPSALLKLYFTPVPGSTILSAGVTAMLFALLVAISVGDIHELRTHSILGQAVPASVFWASEASLFVCLALVVITLVRCSVMIRAGRFF